MIKGQFTAPINIILNNTNKIPHHLSQIENLDSVIAGGESAKLDSNHISMTDRRAAEIVTVKNLVSELESAMSVVSGLTNSLV